MAGAGVTRRIMESCMCILNRIIRLVILRVWNLLYPDIRILQEIAIDEYLRENLYENPKYQDPKKLTRFEHQVYSQNGEDGIIEEIFRRIGTTNKFFVEFGVGNGTENNTANLLLKGWKGHWIEGGHRLVRQINHSHADLIDRRILSVTEAFITAENIEELFRQADVPRNFDLMSVDIDGNDYWIWKSILHYQPRVVAIEYNGMFPPGTPWVVRYNPEHAWQGGSHFGASLQSLAELGRDKGYALVGCNFIGVNAFFVHTDIVQDFFQPPFTAENHYESPRYFLKRTTGYTRTWGPFNQ